MIGNSNRVILHIGLPDMKFDCPANTFLSLHNEDRIYFLSHRTDNELYNSSIGQIVSWENYYYKKKKREISDSLSIFFSCRGMKQSVISINEAHSSILSKTTSYYIADRDTIAERLADFFPAGNIIIPIQNQWDLYYSIWEKLKSFIFFNKSITFGDWVDFHIERHAKFHETIFYCGDFISLIDSYEKWFDNVVVYPVEAGDRYFPDFLTERMEFQRADGGGRLSRLKAETLNNPEKNCTKSLYNNDQIKFISDFTSGINTRISNKTGIDLRKFGYPAVSDCKDDL